MHEHLHTDSDALEISLLQTYGLTHHAHKLGASPPGKVQQDAATDDLWPLVGIYRENHSVMAFICSMEAAS